MCHDIAVVGLSVLFPGSTDNGGFWRDIVAGTDLVREVPVTYWLAKDYYDPNPGTRDMTYCTRGAFLTPVPFDPIEFAIPPSQLPSTDTSQLLALLVAKRLMEGLEQGRGRPVDRERVSVLLGVASATELTVEMTGRLQHPIWAKALRRNAVPESQARAVMQTLSDSYAPWSEATFPGLLGNVVAGRIANRLDLGGTNCVVDAACASSLSALWLAALELDAGRTDLAITGGVDTINDIFMYMCFSKTTALSPTGDARPFSQSADGTVLGEGVGMLALRRLADAERDGDTVYAVLRGIGTASDGAGTSVYAPLATGQVRALERAYADAGYSPGTVELVEAHGTGTVAGDRVELQALHQVFGRAGDARPVASPPGCALGSIKSQIGHTKAAAGSASLFKAVMALHHRVLPPTIKVDKPHADLVDADSPFYLNTRARPWIRAANHPRRASVSAFGFGGSNYHVTLEEYRGRGPRPPKIRTVPTEWVALTGDDTASLASAIDGMLSGIESGARLADLARASQAAFDARKDQRLAIVAADAAELGEKLRAVRPALALDGTGASPMPGVYRGQGPAPGPIAFLFPGQGSQYVDMGMDLAMAFEAARTVWDEADEGTSPGDDGLRLSQVVFPPPAFDDASRKAQAARLTRTEWAQPAIGAASLACLRILREIGIRPAMTAGHSFGEVSALAAAGAMAPAAVLQVARLRGRLMAEHAAAHPGAMVVVFDPPPDLESWLGEAQPGVWIANRNAPNQAALSGSPEAIAALEESLRERRVRHQRLPVGAAFHTPALADVASAFEAALSGVSLAAPSVPVYANATARPYGAHPAGVPALLAGQIWQPVRFAEAIEAMYADGARLFVEVGPGSVLTGLVRQTLGERAAGCVSLDRPGMHGVTALWHAMATLAAAGVVFDSAPLWQEYTASGSDGEAPGRTRSAATVSVGGRNAGRPYPGPEDLEPASFAPDPPAVVEAHRPPPRMDPVPQTTGRPALPAGMEDRMEEQPERTLPTPAAPGPIAAEAAAGGPLVLLQALQSDLTTAHVAYQQALSEGHRAFLQTAEAAMRLMLGGVFEAPAAPTGAAPPPGPPVPAPMTVAPNPGVAPVPVVPAAVVPTPAMASRTASPAPSVAQPSAAPTDAWAMVRRIVAEKTGYPETMLQTGLDLQADLGIDSIKRVEIFSAVREAFPGAEPVGASRLASLRTLDDVVAAVGSVHAGAPRPSASPPPPAGSLSQAPGPSASPADPMETVLETVAEKTGYPIAMLVPSLALDADLGIDSIKRVEIFSALQNRLPGAGTLGAQDIASLRTLDDVAAFLRQRIRGPAPAPTAAEPPSAPAPAGALRARRLRALPAPSIGFGLPEMLRGGEVTLVGGDAPLVKALEIALGGHGISASHAQEMPGERARRVVVLAGSASGLDRARALAVNRQAFRAARAVAAAVGEGEGLFVTVQDTGGDFGLSGQSGERVWLSGLTGLVKTLYRELPQLSVKAMDVAQAGRSPEAVAALVVDELLYGGPEIEVGYDASGRRLVLAPADAEAVAAGTLPLAPGTVVLASGGGRGVTASALIGLARATRLDVAILGRTELADDLPGDEASLMARFAREVHTAGREASPLEVRRRVQTVLASRQIRATLARLGALGSKARYIPVDVRDAERVRLVLDEVRHECGPIGALLHGAGLIRDHLVVDKTDAEFDDVFDTKVLGAKNLLEATKGDPLRHIAFFSSIAGRTGNRGQADYAMANEILGKLAASEGTRRGDGASVQAFAWGPWRGGMVTPGLERHFAEQGINLIPLEAGAEFFCRVWQEAHPAGTEWLVLADGTNLPLSAAHARMEVPVSLEQLPYLQDHAPVGVPVVPMALVLEWMVAASESAHRTRAGTVTDLQVLHGLQLDEAFADAQPLRLSLAEGPARRLVQCLLVDRSGRPRYRAQVHLDGAAEAAQPAASTNAWPDTAGWSAWPGTLAGLYEETLFHGASFQPVAALGRMSEAGATATLTARARDWVGATRTDPLLLDGGLQVLVAWTLAHMHRRSLPTSIARVVRYGEAKGGAPVHVLVAVRSADPERVVADLLWTDPDGEAVLAAIGVETHAVGQTSRGWRAAEAVAS